VRSPIIFLRYSKYSHLPQFSVTLPQYLSK
jgi:hypothetical protein